MKNKLLCLFSIIFLFSMMPSADASFFVKKHAVAVAAANHQSELKSGKVTHIFSGLKNVKNRPYYPFAYGGWIGFFALIFGIAGFFWGGFAVLAMLFGLFGMGRRHRNTGMAIVGFVLGITAILLSIFLKFSGFPIF